VAPNVELIAITELRSIAREMKNSKDREKDDYHWFVGAQPEHLAN
jgi:hypothetical protein